MRLVDELCDRMRVPTAHRDLARLTARHHGNVHRAFELRAATVLELLETCDAFRRAERFSDMLLACQADAQGRAGLADRPYPQREYLEAARTAAAAVTLTEADKAQLKGPQFATVLRERRLAVLEPLRAAVQSQD